MLRAQGVHSVAVTYVDNSGDHQGQGRPAGPAGVGGRVGRRHVAVFDAFGIDDIPVTGRFAAAPSATCGCTRIWSGSPCWPRSRAGRGRRASATTRRVSRTRTTRGAGRGRRWPARRRRATTAQGRVRGRVGDQPARQRRRLRAGRGGPRLRLRAAGRAVGLPARRADRAGARRTSRSSRSIPSTRPGSSSCRSPPRIRCGAADISVLVRETIRAVSQQHGLRVSFSPKVLAEGVGNGGHVHLSIVGRRGTCSRRRRAGSA